MYRKVGISVLVLVSGAFLFSKERTAPPPVRVPAAAAAPQKIADAVAQPKTKPDASIEKAKARIDELVSCQEEGSCPFGGSDPKDTFYTASREISRELESLLPLARDQAEAVDRVAVEMMGYSEDGVRLAALRLLDSLPTSGAGLQAILDALKESNDPALYASAMRSLQRYPSPGDRETIARFLGEAMIHGAPSVSQVVSQNLGPFLGEDTTPIIEEELAQLPPDSLRRTHLSAALGLRNNS